MAEKPGGGVNGGAEPQRSSLLKALAGSAALWFARKAASYGGITLSLTDPKGWKSLGGNQTYTGKSVDDEVAMQISVVWACIRILSETIGALPWGIYRRDSKGNAEAVDHPLSDVLMGSPNEDMTSGEYRETGIVNLGLRGNAYSFKETNGAGNVSSLYPIPSQNCIPLRATDGRILYKVLDRGKWEEYPREKIWHVKGFGSTGLVGYSPISYVRQAMGLSLATEEFGARFFSNGAKPSILVSIPQWLKDDQRKIARENLTALWTGLENAQGVRLLEGGMTAEPVSMPLEDAQFLETRRFQLDEICRIYRIPPHMVANLDRATNNNIEHLSQEFVTFTLMPYLTRIEQSADKWLLKPGDRAKYFLRFNVEGLLRADSAGRAEFYSKMLQNAVFNRNEVRAKENMNRVEGLDDYTVQINMTPIDKLGALADATIRAADRGPQPAQAKGADTIVIPQTHVAGSSMSVVLPESVKTKLELPEFSAMAEATHALANESRRVVARVEKNQVQIGQTLERLELIAKRPRIPVFNEKGDPIAVRIAEPDEKIH